jgi:hypothetical protein
MIIRCAIERHPPCLVCGRSLQPLTSSERYHPPHASSFFLFGRDACMQPVLRHTRLSLHDWFLMCSQKVDEQKLRLYALHKVLQVCLLALFNLPRRSRQNCVSLLRRHSIPINFDLSKLSPPPPAPEAAPQPSSSPPSPVSPIPSTPSGDSAVVLSALAAPSSVAASTHAALVPIDLPMPLPFASGPLLQPLQHQLYTPHQQQLQMPGHFAFHAPQPMLGALSDEDLQAAMQASLTPSLDLLHSLPHSASLSQSGILASEAGDTAPATAPVMVRRGRGRPRKTEAQKLQQLKAKQAKMQQEVQEQDADEGTAKCSLEAREHELQQRLQQHQVQQQQQAQHQQPSGALEQQLMQGTPASSSLASLPLSMMHQLGLPLSPPPSMHARDLHQLQHHGMQQVLFSEQNGIQQLSLQQQQQLSGLGSRYRAPQQAAWGSDAFMREVDAALFPFDRNGFPCR